MNILLALMSLDIGGAETHVVTLAKALKNKGHTVVVVSEGGIYEKELTDMGVVHVYAPLGHKTPQAVLKSFSAMYGAIKNYDIEVVHSHGRIPSLISGIVSNLLGRKFMTTVHAMYKVNSYKWLSLFGKRTICVSEDIRNHIVRHYNVDDRQITIIPNCIDTEKFNHEKKSASEVFTIGYVSRMQGELARRAVDIARMLSSYAYDENKAIKLLIVGDGEDFNDVVAAINQLSKEIAERSGDKKIEIQLLGKRTDIPDLMHQMDTVVCVSRVAMEAMSCGKSVILLGGEGYEGLLTKERYEHAAASNFTGRTSKMSFEEETFIKEIDSLVCDDSLRTELGEWGRQRIIENFSIEQIVDETIDQYKAL